MHAGCTHRYVVCRLFPIRVIMKNMTIKSCVNSPYSAGPGVKRIYIITSSTAAWSQSQISTLKHIQTLPSAAASQQSVKQCKLYKVLRVIKHEPTAAEAFLLLSHISCRNTVIKFKKKRFAAAGSRGLTALITANRKKDPDADRQLTDLCVYVIQKSMNRLTAVRGGWQIWGGWGR